jgi:serine/threonine protein kinase
MSRDTSKLFPRTSPAKEIIMKNKQSTVFINLNKKQRLEGPPPQVQVQPESTPSQPDDRPQLMTMETLCRNYNAIIHAKGIYYPVAYQFPRLLGCGQQGHVFLALRQGARGCITENAIKLYNPALYHSAQAYWTDMGRIAAQISRMQRIQSPNMVSRHSYEETYGIGYVEMEAVDGLDLSRLMKRELLNIAMTRSSQEEWSKFSQSVFRLDEDRMRLQPGFVVYLLRGILRGLDRLHTMGFLHFDLKPGNIMVDRLGSVKIIDFGRALMTNENVSFLFGSPLYMAPETHRREPGSPQSDLYSVGLIALELLAGQPIVTDADTNEHDLLNLKMTLTDHFDSILPSYVLENTDLVGILSKLLAADPDNRYSSAREAEIGNSGLAVIDKQLVYAGLDTEYAHDLSDYLGKLIDPQTERIEAPE